MAFDALTLPAVFFAVPWFATLRYTKSVDICMHLEHAAGHVPVQVASPLQIKGCKRTLQNGAMVGLELIIANCAPPDLQIALVPELQQCNWLATTFLHDFGLL